MKTLTRKQVELYRRVKALNYNQNNCNMLSSKRALDYVRRVDKRIFETPEFQNI